MRGAIKRISPWRAGVAGWLLLAYVAAFAAFTLLAPGPPGDFKVVLDLGQMVAPGGAAALCWLASRRAPSRSLRLSWLFLSLASAGWVLAEGIWSYYELVLGIDNPTPSEADAVWAALYPLIFAGLMLQVPRGEENLGRLTSALDALVFTLGAAGLGWSFLLAPALAEAADPVPVLLTTFYTLGDLLLVFALLSLVLRWPLNRVPVPSLYLLGAFLVQIVADILYTSLVLEGTYQPGGLVAPLWSLTFALGGLAAQAQVRVGAPGEPLATLNLSRARGARTVLPYLALPVAASLLYLEHVESNSGVEADETVAFVLALAMIGLVVLRQFLTLLENHRLSLSLAALSRDLEARVVERTGALRESEERFRSVVQTAREAIVCVDGRGTVVFWNRAAEAIFGYSAEEALGKPGVLLAAERFRGDLQREINRVLSMGAPPLDGRAVEVAGLRKDGAEVPLEMSAASWKRGDELFFTVVLRDVTERKEMKERLLRSQRLETAGRIAGQVAHDFNNLLGPLVAYPELIKRQLPPGHRAASYCDAMLEAAGQMVDINSDMLALSRRGLLDRQPTDLSRLVQQAAEQLRESPRSLKVELELSPDLFPVSGSPAELLRVLSNLLTNAREAMRDLGLLRIRTENVYVDLPSGRCNQVEVGEYVRLDVADTGCGIAPEIRDRIFDAFFSTKRGPGSHGCGLGLSVVQALVEDHHGYVDLETEVGRGTTFSLYLPVHREPVPRAQVEAWRGGTEAILVVDDDRVQREIARLLLEPLGYRVEEAHSGEEALAHLERSPADLLILDMVMPGGIDGAETFRQALQRRPEQRAILVCGAAETERVREARALGAGACVPKPVALERLARAVREGMDGARAEPG